MEDEDYDLDERDDICGIPFEINNQQKEVKDEYDFDSQCESCGELLEDCQPDCDGWAISRKDISMGDFDDNEKENAKSSFDKFNSMF